ncbi:class I SAM-dependent methyltransferase [Novispirillum sp. DQ9]|uniref:class I SAM-dependent methyltransferase n=1 Tax=Novispirillum sp. DQ9 TaxID=3398612 RepID=UPI003C7D9130
MLGPHLDFPNARVFHCGGCGHAFAYPEPPIEWLDTYYRDIYSPRRAGWVDQPYIDIMKRRAAAQTEFIAAHWPAAGENGFSGINAVELGCGIGALTAALGACGARVRGSDGDHKIIEIGRKAFPGADICCAQFQDELAHEPLNLIAMSHVVEHMVSVESTLQDLKRRLIPGRSAMFIEVPNTFAEQFAQQLDMETHVHFFTATSLRILLERTGFLVEACRGCGPTFERLLAHPAGAPAQDLFGDDYGIYHDGPNPDGIWIRALATLPQD